MIGQKKIDEFAFVLLGAIIFISIMAVYWYPKAEVISSVKPNKITIHSLPGETIESSFNLTAQGTMNLEAGGQIASWIDFTDDTVYASGKEQIVTFEVNVPSDTALGIYTGYIEVKGNETSKQIPVEIIVENKTMYKERRISIPDFSISYEGSTNALHREKNVEIYAGLIRHKKKTFVVTLTDEQISSMRARISSLRGWYWRERSKRGTDILTSISGQGPGPWECIMPEPFRPILNFENRGLDVRILSRLPACLVAALLRVLQQKNRRSSASLPFTPVT